MTPTPSLTAASLFFGAIRDLLRNPGAVLRIGAAWFLVYLGFNALAGQRYAHWVIYDVNRINQEPPSEWYVSLIFLVMLGAVASAWHRFIYLAEAPRFIPRMRLVIIAKYMLAWVLVGLVVGAIVLAVFVLPVVALMSVFSSTAGAELTGEWYGWQLWQISGAVMPAGFLAGWIILATCALILAVFLLFRLGLGLPSVAILDGQGLGLKVSWRATRAMAGAIVGASLLVAVVLALFIVSLRIWAPSLEAGYATGMEVGYRLASGAVDIVTMLIVTAVLTRIYRSAPPDLV